MTDHKCGDDCDCFIECPECGEPFCRIMSEDSDSECLAHVGDWDIREHSHEKLNSLNEELASL